MIFLPEFRHFSNHFIFKKLYDNREPKIFFGANRDYLRRLSINDLIMIDHCPGPILNVRNAVGFATFAKPREYGVYTKKLAAG